MFVVTSIQQILICAMKKTVNTFILFCTIRYLTSIKCGQPKIAPNSDSHFKITGGREAIPYSWPWQVYLKIHSVKYGVAGCAGTLINDQWIVTVAHCFFYGTILQVTAKLGICDRTKCPIGSTHFHFFQKNFKSSVFIHPGFDNTTTTLHNDIALIKLPHKIKYNDDLSPICLPREDTTVNVIGTTLTVTGWGLTSAGSPIPHKLRQAVVSIQPSNKPNVFGCYYKRDFVNEKQICAGAPAHDHIPRKGVCLYDSGGPLVKKNVNLDQWFQYGIASYGHYPCGKASNNADGYTRVAYYCNWIEQVIGETICQPKSNRDNLRNDEL